MIGDVIILAVLVLLLALFYVNIEKGNEPEASYEIAFGIQDHNMIGGGSYSMSYHQSTNFDDIISVFSKNLELVLPESEAVLIENLNKSDIDLIGNKVSQYWVRFSIKKIDQTESNNLDLEDCDSDSYDSDSYDSAEDAEDSQEDSQEEENHEELEEGPEEQDAYFLIYYSNVKKDYNVLVRQAIADSLEEINDMNRPQYTVVSDDDD